jgi:molybdopterin-containing oxidoreductase family iron-sulfur binding subunit
MSDVELLLALLANEPSAGKPLPPPPAPGQPEDPGVAFKAVRDTFNAVVPGASDDKWNHALRDGFVGGTAYAAVTSEASGGAAGSVLAAAVDVPPGEGMEVTFVPCSKIHDGRFVNNGWLQEAPDPISKLTWDNAAIVSVKTAKDLGINLFNEDSADVVSVEVNGVKRYFPVLVIPGHADNALSIAVGYGQTDAGRVARGTGFDAYALRLTTWNSTPTAASRDARKFRQCIRWG